MKSKERFQLVLMLMTSTFYLSRTVHGDSQMAFVWIIMFLVVCLWFMIGNE